MEHVCTPLCDNDSSSVTRHSCGEVSFWRLAGQLLPHARGGFSVPAPSLSHQARGTPVFLQNHIPLQSLGLSIGDQGAKSPPHPKDGLAWTTGSLENEPKEKRCLPTGKGWDCPCSSAPALHLCHQSFFPFFPPSRISSWE